MTEKDYKEMVGYVDKMQNNLVKVNEDIEALTDTLAQKELIVRFQKGEIVMLRAEVEWRDKRIAELEAICNEAGIEV